jgi:sec-independent protein translocase protein TatB
MFGIEFPELVVIAVVALIVIGPEHLPKVARTMGHLWGRAQRYINTVKSDMSRDMALEELRKLQQTAQQEFGNISNSMHEAKQEVNKQVHEIQEEVVATGSKYNLGSSIPPSELEAKVLPREEQLKSEQPKPDLTASNAFPVASTKHEKIEEEHHAVMPVSIDQTKSTNT